MYNKKKYLENKKKWSSQFCTDVVKFIKLRRLQWAGLVERIDSSDIPKNVLTESCMTREDWEGQTLNGWTLSQRMGESF